MNSENAARKSGENLLTDTITPAIPEPDKMPPMKRKRPTKWMAHLNSDPEIVRFKNLLFSQRCIEDSLLHEDIEIVKLVIYLCVRQLVYCKIEYECEGCKINNQNLDTHNCWGERPMYYFDRSYDKICECLYTPELHWALAYALHTIRGKSVSSERLLGAVEVILSDLRREPFIIEKLKQTTDDVVYKKKSRNNDILNKSVDIWMPTICMADIYQNDSL